MSSKKVFNVAMSLILLSTSVPALAQNSNPAKMKSTDFVSLHQRVSELNSVDAMIQSIVDKCSQQEPMDYQKCLGPAFANLPVSVQQIFALRPDLQKAFSDFVATTGNSCYVLGQGVPMYASGGDSCFVKAKNQFTKTIDDAIKGYNKDLGSQAKEDPIAAMKTLKANYATYKAQLDAQKLQIAQINTSCDSPQASGGAVSPTRVVTPTTSTLPPAAGSGGKATQ